MKVGAMEETTVAGMMPATPLLKALRNAAKHVVAVPVRVALTYGETQVELRIEDAGAGFDLKTIQGNGGLRLLSMRGEARSIGATFRIAEVGEGTNTIVRVPFEKAHRIA
jgi:signal transduction histidine kinase